MKKQLSAFRGQLSGESGRILHFLKAASCKLKATAPARQRGFTLVEMLVALMLFAVVMVVCVGALLALVGADKKAQALESVVNNLNISLDEMARSIREGSDFNCGGANIPNLSTSNADCTAGSQEFSYAPYGSDTTQQSQRTVYLYAASGSDGCVTPNGSGGCIVRSENGGSTYSAITGSDISIPSNGFEFYVVGTRQGCDTGSGSSCAPIQPRVIIIVDGSANASSVHDTTAFHLQVTALQRVLDL